MIRAFLGAYWGPRRESVGSCARRLSDLLMSMAECGWSSTEWRVGATAVKPSLEQPIKISREAITQLLAPNKSETDGSVIEDLGFSLSFWAGDPERPTGFSATCGAFASQINNSVVLRFPAGDPILEYPAIDFENLLRCFVDCLEPNAAVLSSMGWIKKHKATTAWESGGWISYSSETQELVVSKDDWI
ncbi:MAG: Imm52 family immunity protein [Pseudomonadota bacterium]